MVTKTVISPCFLKQLNLSLLFFHRWGLLRKTGLQRLASLQVFLPKKRLWGP
ncbi:Uncharacterised protein [Vibrio cholerae]|nr:Uncharacterised protein [Vibrio cholerae]